MGPAHRHTVTAARADRLARLTDEHGRFRVLALDHRDSLRAVLAPDDGAHADEAGLRVLKAHLVAATAHLVSGVMLDPELGLLDDVLRSVPDGVGVLAPLEEQGYLADATVTHTTVLPGWGPTAAATRGADAVKLLALWDGEVDRKQRGVIDDAVAEARAADVPLVLEPLPRGLDSHGAWVLDWAREHLAVGADVFKLPYPGSPAGCARLTELLPAPWVLLSAGLAFDTFLDQTTTAMTAGAQGYMVGRAVWREAATLDATARAAAIERLVVPRLRRLGEVGS